MLEVGRPAPKFRLPSLDGKLVGLEDFLGKSNLVVYFYPKDFTRGCTAEACGFSEAYEEFKKAGAEVIGISGDSLQSHEAFVRQYKLPFILLSDSDGSARQAYQVKKSLGFIPGRVSFVIDKQGIIRHIFSSQVRATAHVDEALAVLKSLS